MFGYPCWHVQWLHHINRTEGILLHPPRLHIQNVLLASWEAQNNDKADIFEDGLIMANVPFVEFLKTKQTIIPLYMPPQGFAWLGVTQASVHGCMNTKQATTPPYLLRKDFQYTKWKILWQHELNSFKLSFGTHHEAEQCCQNKAPLGWYCSMYLSTAKYRDGAPFCLCMIAWSLVAFGFPEQLNMLDLSVQKPSETDLSKFCTGYRNG